MSNRRVPGVGVAGVHRTTGTTRVPLRAHRYRRRAANNRAHAVAVATGQATG